MKIYTGWTAFLIVFCTLVLPFFTFGFLSGLYTADRIITNEVKRRRIA